MLREVCSHARQNKWSKDASLEFKINYKVLTKPVDKPKPKTNKIKSKKSNTSHSLSTTSSTNSVSASSQFLSNQLQINKYTQQNLKMLIAISQRCDCIHFFVYKYTLVTPKSTNNKQYCVIEKS